MADQQKRVQVTITAKDETQSTLDSVKSSLKGLLALNVGQLLAEGFAKVVEGLKSMVQEAINAEAAFQRLSFAINQIGNNSGKTTEQISEFTKNLARSTGQSGEDVENALGAMILKTGDVTRSLNGVTLAAKMADEMHIDLATAVNYVTKAMDGNDGVAKRLGFTLKEGQHAIDAFQEKFGNTTTTTQTFEKVLNSLHESWKEFEQTIGNFLIKNPQVIQMFEDIGAKLLYIGAWIKANKDVVAAWIDTIVSGIGWLGTMAGKVVVFFDKAYTEFEELVNGLAGVFVSIPDYAQYAFGQVMKYLGDFILAADIALGISLGEGLAASLIAKGESYIKAAGGAIQAIHDEIKGENDRLEDQFHRFEEGVNKLTQVKAPKGGFSVPANDNPGFDDGGKAEREELQKHLEELAREWEEANAQRVEMIKNDRELLSLGQLEIKDQRTVVEGANRLRELQEKVTTQLREQKDLLPEQRLELQKIQTEINHILTELLRHEGQDWLNGVIEGWTDNLYLAKNATMELNAAWNLLGANMLNNIAPGFEKAFEAVLHGKDAFAELAKAAKKAIGDTVIAEGKKHEAVGLAKIAESGWPPNPLALATGIKEIAAGAALVALGSELGAGGGGSGGRGGSGGGASASGLNSTQNALGATKPGANVVVQGSKYILDPNNPESVDEFDNMITTIVSRGGLSSITFTG